MTHLAMVGNLIDNTGLLSGNATSMLLHTESGSHNGTITLIAEAAAGRKHTKWPGPFLLEKDLFLLLCLGHFQEFSTLGEIVTTMFP